MASGRHLFTSESVSMGHPDKLADQISDGVLDALIGQGPHEPRGLRNDGHDRPGVIAGEITTKAYVDYAEGRPRSDPRRRLHRCHDGHQLPTLAPCWSRSTSKAPTSRWA